MLPDRDERALAGVLPGATRSLGGTSELAQPLVQREVRPVLLAGGDPEQLVRMTEVTARTTAARDTLALPEPTGLELAGAVGNAVEVDEVEMGAPDSKSSGALDGGTTHGLDPSLGSHARAEHRARVATLAG